MGDLPTGAKVLLLLQRNEPSHTADDGKLGTALPVRRKATLNANAWEDLSFQSVPFRRRGEKQVLKKLSCDFGLLLWETFHLRLLYDERGVDAKQYIFRQALDKLLSNTAEVLGFDRSRDS